MTDAIQTTRFDDPALRVFIHRLWRRYPIVVAAVVLASASALTSALRSEKQYTATAKLLFRDPAFDQKLFGASLLSPSRDPVREAATNVTLTSLDVVFERTARLMPRPMTAMAVRSRVRVASEGQADVVAVAATDASPETAAMLANTVARQYIEFRRDADRSKITEAISSVRQKLTNLSEQETTAAAGTSVRERIAQLEILASLQTGNAELVQQAAPPTGPSSPRPIRETILAAFVGLFLGVGLALLLDRIDRRLRTGSDAEEILQRPVLGAIPESRVLRAGGDSLVLGRSESEAFRTLRTNLRYFSLGHDIRSLLVTSSAAGDGKSTIARCLAAAAATSRVNVILVEADFRRPSTQRLYPVLARQGLTNVLAGDASLSEVIQQVDVTRGDDLDEVTALDVITAGPVPPNPADLLESDRMSAVLTELQSRYDLVVIDTPPMTIVPDAIPLLNQVSGVAIVVRAHKSTRDELRRLRKQMANLEVSPLGVIINGVGSADGEYSYYGYDFDKSDSSVRKGSEARRVPSLSRAVPSRR